MVTQEQKPIQGLTIILSHHEGCGDGHPGEVAKWDQWTKGPSLTQELGPGVEGAFFLQVFTLQRRPGPFSSLPGSELGV